MQCCLPISRLSFPLFLMQWPCVKLCHIPHVFSHRLSSPTMPYQASTLTFSGTIFHHCPLSPGRVMDLGGNHFQCGLARTIMCMAEVPFFTTAGLLVKHVGVRGMVSMTQAGYLTRFIYYSVSVSFNPNVHARWSAIDQSTSPK